ncbi:MAG: hypothetical protein KDA60_11985 [Planctomycetales bacterium]|nr:hypothetical protein [Planctomycetales bacterium]
MVLVLIVLAALVSVGISRRSLAYTRDGIEQAQAVRTRWHATSIRHSLLDSPQQHFSVSQPQAASRLLTEGPRILRKSIELDGMTYEVTLADENTKANVNQLYETGGVRAVTDCLYQVVRDNRFLQVRTPTAQSAARNGAPYASFGQLFALESIPHDLVAGELVQSETERFSCWGSGRLNIHLADDPTLGLVVNSMVTPRTMNRLRELRGEEGFKELSLDEILRSLELRASERVKLKRWLTTTSDCYSLWIRSHDSGMLPRTDELTVSVVESDRATQVASFTW